MHSEVIFFFRGICDLSKFYMHVTVSMRFFKCVCNCHSSFLTMIFFVATSLIKVNEDSYGNMRFIELGDFEFMRILFFIV